MIWPHPRPRSYMFFGCPMRMSEGLLSSGWSRSADGSQASGYRLRNVTITTGPRCKTPPKSSCVTLRYLPPQESAREPAATSH